MPSTESQKSCVHIRWMIRRDMPSVIEIEENSFEFPWSEDEFIRCLRQRNCIGMVAELSEQVVGFMIYELHKNPTAYPEFLRSSRLPPTRNWSRDGRQVGRQVILSTT